MKRQAIGGLVLFGLLLLAVNSSVRAQDNKDAVTVRDANNTTKTYNGVFKVSPDGFQVVAGDKVVVKDISPDQIVKIAIGDLPGVEREAIRTAAGKEEKRDFAGARTIYAEQYKKAGNQERSKRYLQFKQIQLTNKIVDDLDADKGWKEAADKCIAEWTAFLAGPAEGGWELWPAVRACTRLQIERGKLADAAAAWGRVSKSANLPPDAKLEAALQEIDLQIRSKAYAPASASTTALLPTATGAKKDRLTIYALAAKAASDKKSLEAIEKIRAEMNKTKDVTVHTTGFSMLGELFLDAGKPRDAAWEFLWVETIFTQDKDETLKALSRLIEAFEAQTDTDQAEKYREKLKRLRATF